MIKLLVSLVSLVFPVVLSASEGGGAWAAYAGGAVGIGLAPRPRRNRVADFPVVRCARGGTVRRGISSWLLSSPSVGGAGILRRKNEVPVDEPLPRKGSRRFVSADLFRRVFFFDFGLAAAEWKRAR